MTAPLRHKAGSSIDTVLSGLPGGARLEPELLQRCLDHAQSTWSRDSLAAAIQIGRHVIDTLFRGDAALAELVGGRHPTLRALRRSRLLPFAAAYLWTCIRLVGQVGAFTEAGVGALPFSHHRVLLGVRDERVRVAMARAAHEKGWTRKHLVGAIAATASGTPAEPRPGRLPRPVLAEVADGLEALQRTLGEVRPRARPLTEDEAALQRRRIAAAMRAIERTLADAEGKAWSEAEPPCATQSWALSSQLAEHAAD